MNKKVLVIAVALMAVAMLTLPMSVVSATTPTQITGEWKFTGFIPPAYSDPKKAGANFFVTQYNKGEYFDGDILGTFEQVIDMTFHYGDPATVKNLPPNPMVWLETPHDYNWKIERSFTGTVDVNGDVKSGTLTMHLNAKGSSPFTLRSLEGTWVIISGTGELANLHGQGTWTNLVGLTLEYEGQIHFDP